MTQEEKAKAYDEAYKRVAIRFGSNVADELFPELRESEDERMKKELIKFLQECHNIDSGFFSRYCEIPFAKMLAWLEKQGEPQDKGEISDGYHTFNELYYYRMLYNAAFFNMLPKEWVHKSKKHNDGEECFGGGWFIVMANLPTGQVSNHYELKDWDLFQIPEKEVADEWDGHTPQEAADRLHKYLLEKQEGCEYIKKDWLEHIKQSWYKEGFIDGKYSGGTSKEWTINDATTLNELIDFLENGTAKLQHDLTRYANWLKIQFTPIEKQGEQKPFDYENANIQQKDWAEIPFGTKDSELQEATYIIPEGFHAEIKGNKVFIKKGEQKSAWSKWDEVKINRIVACLENLNVADNDILLKDIDWLKSLKQRIGG